MNERRTYHVQLRKTGAGRKLVGYAAVFNETTRIHDFLEVVRPGAFAKTIRSADVRALWNHNDDYVLGRTKSGTLKLREDDKGLAVEIDPPNATWANDLLETISRGDVDQMSFAFAVVSDRWGTENGKTLRELLEVDLYDVSPVTYPAYKQTTIVSEEARKHVQVSRSASNEYILARIKLLEAETALDGFDYAARQQLRTIAELARNNATTDIVRRRLELLQKLAE